MTVRSIKGNLSNITMLIDTQAHNTVKENCQLLHDKNLYLHIHQSDKSYKPLQLS